MSKQIQIYNNDKLLGHMDDYDTNLFRAYQYKPRSVVQDDDDFFDLQDKYQEKYGADDWLDFVDPEEGTIVQKLGRCLTSENLKEVI